MAYINSMDAEQTRNFIAGVMKSRFIKNRQKMALATMATNHLNNLLAGIKL